MSSPGLPGWGRRAGHLELARSPTPLELSGMRDRLLALEAVHRYAWAYDERDITLLDDVLAEDVIFEGSIAGSTSVGPVTGRSSVTTWLRGHMSAQDDQRRHTMHNEIVCNQSDAAVQVAASLLLTSSNGSTSTVVTSGFYVMDTRPDVDRVWRIGRIFAGFDSQF